MISNCDHLVIRGGQDWSCVLPPEGYLKTVGKGAGEPKRRFHTVKIDIAAAAAAPLRGRSGRRGGQAGCAAARRLQGDARSAYQYQPGTPFDRWAFSQIYAAWLKRLREHSEPLAESQADEGLFLPQTPGVQSDSAFASFFAGLPPQQRGVMLLVYGERFSYADAAKVVDAPTETIALRAGRALANYAEHLNGLTSAAESDARVEVLHPSGETSDD